MHHSTPIQTESQTATKQKWEEPIFLAERFLTVNAQGPGPQIGPAFSGILATVEPPPPGPRPPFGSR